MKTDIYYFTGTGNSLWTARLLAAEIGDAQVLSMAAIQAGTVCSDADAIGFVFPVHIWGVPGFVLDFIERIKKDRSKYYFAFAVNAGQVSSTLLQLRKILENNGLELSAGFDIILPSNYIPWGGPPPVEEQNALFNLAAKKIRAAASIISAKQKAKIECGPMWQRIIFTALYRMSYDKVRSMDKPFYADEKCTSCGICFKVCPVNNIVMKDEKPSWLHNCVQCLSCIQWCPEKALQYGKKTHAYERYHNPEIKLKDIIKF